MESRNHKITKSIGKITTVLAAVVLAMFAGKIESTNSSFSNRELSSGNYFEATVWGEIDASDQNENSLMSIREITAEEMEEEIIKEPEKETIPAETLTLSIEPITDKPEVKDLVIKELFVIEEPDIVPEPDVIPPADPEEGMSQEPIVPDEEPAGEEL